MKVWEQFNKIWNMNDFLWKAKDRVLYELTNYLVKNGKEDWEIINYEYNQPDEGPKYIIMTIKDKITRKYIINCYFRNDDYYYCNTEIYKTIEEVLP